MIPAFANGSWFPTVGSYATMAFVCFRVKLKFTTANDLGHEVELTNDAVWALFVGRHIAPPYPLVGEFHRQVVHLVWIMVVVARDGQPVRAEVPQNLGDGQGHFVFVGACG